MLSDQTLRYAEDLTPAILGVDALCRAEQTNNDPTVNPVDRESLVLLNMSTTHRPELFASYAEARARFQELCARAAELPEPDRRLYYRQFCDSTIAFTHWRAGNLPFERQVSDFLHVPAEPVSGQTLDELKTAIRRILIDLGYGGDLAAQFAAWEARIRVPPDEVAGTLTELMSQAWDRTAQVMEIPAPKSDGMGVVAERGVPYNARCDYGNRVVALNIDPVLTLPGLKHLAVHEGYPGHYVQFKRREAGYAVGRVPADALLSIVNTASSCTFEGIADVGMRVIGWDREPDDRLAGLLSRYRAALGTTAAWRLHALNWPADRVRDWLMRQSLTGGEGAVAARMRFITAPHRTALVWSYWWGETAVAPVWSRVADRPDRHPAYVSYVYDRMHSTQSVALFAG